MLQIEIDNGSGFCFGVTTAIQKAEEELAAGKTLYCLGDIVHNGMECERLKKLGLVTINHEEMSRLQGYWANAMITRSTWLATAECAKNWNRRFASMAWRRT